MKIHIVILNPCIIGDKNINVTTFSTNAHIIPVHENTSSTKCLVESIESIENVLFNSKEQPIHENLKVSNSQKPNRKPSESESLSKSENVHKENVHKDVTFPKCLMELNVQD